MREINVGGSIGSSSTNSTTFSAPPGYIGAAYRNIVGQAQNVAATPYTPYSGNLTAGLSGAQQQAISGLGDAQGAFQPYYDQASQYGDQSTTALTPMEFNADTLSQYQNPYTQDVVDATISDLQRVFGKQQNQVTGNAITSGAWGGDRAGIVKSNLAGEQARTAATTLAGLRQAAYDNAVQQFNTANQTQLGAQQQNNANALAAAGLYQGLGTGASTNAVNLGNALLNAGGVEQQTQQNAYDAAYQQWLNQLQYPFQALSWLTGVTTGVGSNAGGIKIGNSETTGGSLGVDASNLSLSDERVKDGIEPVGQLFDGQTIYRFTYAGDSTPRIGLLAQDVAGVHPEAVGVISGLGAVDYGRATDEAAGLGRVLDMQRGEDGTYADGGGVMPYSAGKRQAGLGLPILQPARGSGPPQGEAPSGRAPTYTPQSPRKMSEQDQRDLQKSVNDVKDLFVPRMGSQDAQPPMDGAPAGLSLAPIETVPSGGLGGAADAARSAIASGLGPTFPGVGLGIPMADGGAVDDGGFPLIFDPTPIAARRTMDDESAPLIFGPEPMKDQSRLVEEASGKGDRLPISGLGMLPDNLPAAPPRLGGLAYAPDAPPVQAGLGAPPSGPRGVRNSNPGNIEDGPFARSQPGYAGSDGRYAVFESPEAGYGAMNKLLDVYGNKHGLNTVSGIVNRWAPSSADNNDTSGYVNYVAKRLGVDPNAPLSSDQRAGLAPAMAFYENGRDVPASGNPLAVADGSVRIRLGARAPQAGLGAGNAYADETALPPNAQAVAGLGQPPQVDSGKSLAGAFTAGLLGLLATGNVGQAGLIGMQTYRDLENRQRGLLSPDERYAQLQADKLEADIAKARSEATKGNVQNLNGRLVYFDPRTGAARDITPAGMPSEWRPLVTPEERRAAGVPASYTGIVQQNTGTGELKVPSVGTSVNIDQRGETEEAKALGTARGKAAAEVESGARNAVESLSKLNLLGTLLQRARTGALGPTEATAVSWAQALGLDPAKLGLNPTQAIDQQAIAKITNELTVGMIGAGGFPANNFSDADRKFLSDIFPKMSNRPESNAIALEVLRRVQQRKMDYADAWGAYQEDRSAEGKPASFGDFERSYRRDHRRDDLFGDIRAQLANPTPGGAPSGGVARPQTAREYEALPSGTRFLDPQGRERVKP